jgi:hypothetical protein
MPSPPTWIFSWVRWAVRLTTPVLERTGVAPGEVPPAGSRLEYAMAPQDTASRQAIKNNGLLMLLFMTDLLGKKY